MAPSRPPSHLPGGSTAGSHAGDVAGEAAGFRHRLRAATDPLHRALEATPFFLTLAGEGASGGGEVPPRVEPGSYAGHLEATRILYRALESVRPDAEPFPLAALDADLAAMRRVLPPPGPGGFAPVARVRAQVLAHRIRTLAGRGVGGGGLLGVVYVLEGAGLGARVLYPRTKAWLGEVLQEGGGAAGGTAADGGAAGSAWLGALAERGPRAWAAFLRELSDGAGSNAAGPEWEREVIEVAGDTFGALASVARALQPLRQVPDREWDDELVRELNPHAGAHPVPREAEVLEAALRAGERSWEAWPYYEARYGERGRAFTRSDSAWLVTLAALPRDRAVEQIVWLADLLSHRGMPRMLMEDHLRILHEELSALGAGAERSGGVGGAVDDGAGGADTSRDPWGLLLHAADLLAERRLAVISDRASQGIARRFQARVPAEAARRVPGAGRLLAAALADEADGLPSAVEALEVWLADPDLFPEAAWAAEVRRTIRAVRKRRLEGG